jgi:GWxTD domain-containing protein
MLPSAFLLISFFASTLIGQSLRSQLNPKYKQWFDEDVRWIITDQERREFLKLGTDDRDNFEAEFWAWRNPAPSSKENAFKQEHYRRLSYANEHFAVNIPGWMTDRRIYIIYGPPDSIDSSPSGSSGYPYENPSEVWHYRRIKGGGDNVSLKASSEESVGKSGK